MSTYPWHIIGGVTADGLSFRTWRRGLVYTAEDTQDAKAKVSEAQDDFPHVYGLDTFRRGDAMPHESRVQVRGGRVDMRTR